MKFLELSNWKIAGILAIIYFPIITFLSIFTWPNENYDVMIVSSICTTVVFFILVWWIFSLWRKKHEKERVY